MGKGREGGGIAFGVTEDLSTSEKRQTSQRFSGKMHWTKTYPAAFFLFFVHFTKRLL